MEEKKWFETMDGNPEKDWFSEQSYFSSPIWFENATHFLKNVIKVSDKYTKLEKKRIKKTFKLKNDYGVVYQSGGLEKVPELKEFTEYVGKRSWDFLDSQGFDLSNFNLIYKDMWCQEFSENGGGFQNSHSHPNVHVTGFYFLECSAKTSRPVLSDPRPGAVMTKLPLKQKTNICHGSEEINFVPSPGTLMIFNPYIPHSFPVVPGKEPFKFIHFNLQAVPKGLIDVI